MTTIESEIGKTKEALSRVQASREGHLQRVRDLEDQRRVQIVPARAKGDVRAREALCKIDNELTAARREEQDDAQAATELAGTLQQLETALKSSQREEARQRVCALIQAELAADRGRQIAELSTKLNKIGVEMKLALERIRAGMQQFNPDLISDVQQLGKVPDRIGDMILWALRDAAPNPLASSSHMRFLADLNPATVVSDRLKAALGAVQAAE